MEAQGVTWKTHNCGKNHDSPQAVKNTTIERNTQTRKRRGNDLSSSSLSHAAAVTTRRQQPLSLSHSVMLCTLFLLQLFNNSNNNLMKNCALSRIILYLYDFSAYLHLCPSDRFGTDWGRFCNEPVLCILHPVPSGGTCFPTELSYEH